MNRLSDIGEISLIKRLCSGLTYGDNVIVAPGDDCAVVRSEEKAEYDILLTSDPVTENIHFLPDTDPAAIGHKAIGRVLSDIAAMGGQPLWCLLNTAAPKSTPVSTADGIIKGASAIAKANNVSIVGGDLSEGITLSIHAFAAGRVKRGSAILRSGAKPGNAIFVTGKLGNSIKDKHLSFIPRLSEGQYLRDKATSAIDITDGLLLDLKRVLEASNVGAELSLNKIPLSEDALNADDEASPLEHALTDGEDFELLFTLPADRKDNIIANWDKLSLVPCTEIGSITSKTGILDYIGVDDTINPEKLSGYLHFKQEKN